MITNEGGGTKYPQTGGTVTILLLLYKVRKRSGTMVTTHILWISSKTHIQNNSILETESKYLIRLKNPFAVPVCPYLVFNFRSEEKINQLLGQEETYGKS